jgi:hypothetical protein
MILVASVMAKANKAYVTFVIYIISIIADGVVAYIAYMIVFIINTENDFASVAYAVEICVCAHVFEANVTVVACI